MSLKEQGNKYVLTNTVSGIPTFKHIETNEVLHGQVGPYEEAIHLYVNSSNLLHLQQKNVVVYDLGMGCGAQLIAMYQSFLQNLNINKLTVVSFDLEKEGLIALQENLALFPYVKEFSELLPLCISQNKILYQLPDGRLFEWIFVQGNFCETIAFPAGTYPLANVVCYDFFSPASHPHLWTLQVFLNLKAHLAVDSKIITYSSATCARAVMFASGLFVGFGPISGKKSKSTIATTIFFELQEPLSLDWRNTFGRSEARFSLEENSLDKDKIVDLVETHPQWKLL